MTLATLGYDEASVREHTLPWVVETLEKAQAENDARVAVNMQSTFLATAAAFNGGDTQRAMQRVIDDLTRGVRPQAQQMPEMELDALLGDSLELEKVTPDV